MKKYFYWSGIIAHLIFAVLIGLSFRSIYWYGLPLPVYSQKVANDLRVNYPSASFLIPAFEYLASFEQKNFYFRTLEPEANHSAGANADFRPTLLDDAIHVHDSESLRDAITRVKPGQQILLSPGDYIFSNTLEVRTAGLPEQPIRLTGASVHDVKVDLKNEGLLLSAPYWIIENITFTGSCAVHDDCEHAIHIVGKAQYAVIRNNVFRDFNAAIKVNGHANDYPDGGILESNTFYNTTARNTTAAATPIDIVATNDWLISENFIFDIQKSAGDRVSYAAFAKGNASGTIFERNLVICEANVKGGQHTAIGLSLGGGGTGSGFFRSDIETIEHARGAIRNNIIMHCPNDVGVYINNSDETLVENNIIYNTVGVDVRYSKSNVIVRNNVISGRVRERDGGKVTLENNLIKPRYFINGEDQLKRYFKAADIADFGWIDSHDVELTPRENAPSKTKDFCGSLVSSAYLGAFAGSEFCNKN